MSIGEGLAWTFPAGKYVSNYETLGAVSSKSFTVPTDKLWVVMGFMYVERDANATLDIALHDPDDNKIADLITQVAAGTTNLYFPESIAGTAGDLETWKMLKNLPLGVGWYVKVTWGAAQTTPEVCFPVRQIDL